MLYNCITIMLYNCITIIQNNCIIIMQYTATCPKRLRSLLIWHYLNDEIGLWSLKMCISDFRSIKMSTVLFAEFECTVLC